MGMGYDRKVSRKPGILWGILALAILSGCGSDSSSASSVTLNRPIPAAVSKPPFTILYSFDGAFGANPWGSLTLATTSNGPTLCGRTRVGGTGWQPSTTDVANAGGGIVFCIPLTAGPPVMSSYAFTTSSTLPASGNQPHHDSMILIGSTLFGVTLHSLQIDSQGEGVGLGTIFTVDPQTLAYTALYNFLGPANGGPRADGANSHSNFSLSTDGTRLYGSTSLGGTNGQGTQYIFNLVPSPSYAGVTVSHTIPTGSQPHGRPYVIDTGNGDLLIGMTRVGGASAVSTNIPPIGNGVIYALNPTTRVYTVLHNFPGSPSGGATPDHGNLIFTGPPSGGTTTAYGLTTSGGSGTRTKIKVDIPDPTDPSKTIKVDQPGSGVLIQTVVTYTSTPPTASTTVLHNFGDTATDLRTGATIPDGYNPHGSLVFANGFLYGMTASGGTNDGGVVFRIRPDGTGYGILGSFDDKNNNLTGSGPLDNVIVSADGSTLYGMTLVGGANDPQTKQANGFGAVFSIPANP